MKKKVTESARRLMKKLFEAILDREAFIFEAPKAFTRNLSRDMLTDDQLEVIDEWKNAVRGQLNTAEKLHADKRGLADHGDTYFEMLPLPAPNIIVMCDKCLIRYEIEVFAYKKGVLLSAVQAAVSENGVGIAGINLSGKERALVQTARQLTALDFLKKSHLPRPNVRVARSAQNQHSFSRAALCGAGRSRPPRNALRDRVGDAHRSSGVPHAAAGGRCETVFLPCSAAQRERDSG